MGIAAVTVPLRRAIFLDRDGVLNRAIVRNGRPYPPGNMKELEILAGVLQALQALKRAGFLLIGVTNQPDVARGSQKREDVEAINAALVKALPLDEILVCYHDERDNCECRKPRPGLLVQAARRHAIDLSSSFMIGDRWKDVEAGHRAGCATFLIDCGYAESRPDGILPDYTVHSLGQATTEILARLASSVRETL